MSDAELPSGGVALAVWRVGMALWAWFARAAPTILATLVVLVVWFGRRRRQRHLRSTAQTPSPSPDRGARFSPPPNGSAALDWPLPELGIPLGVPSSILHGAKRLFVRDVNYGYIEIDPLAKQFIDTPEFQELRDLRQLGLASFVFPSATHTRFEHSLGVYHVVGDILATIESQQPWLFPTESAAHRKRAVDLVKLAGLLHDLGHAAFSHTFDEQIAKVLGLPDHEERGVQMLRRMVLEHRLPVDKDEVEFVAALILGDPVQPAWLGALVHNTENELDADKIDYINRDSYYLGLGRPIQANRIISHIRVLQTPPTTTSTTPSTASGTTAGGEGKTGGTIRRQASGVRERSGVVRGCRVWSGVPCAGEDWRLCLHQKVYWQVSDVFTVRWRLFREVYRHKASVGLNELMGDLLRLLKPVLARWLQDGLRPIDSLLPTLPFWLPLVPDNVIAAEDREKAMHLFLRLRTRKLYKLHQRTHAGPDNVRVRIGLSALPDDPMTHIWFYDDDGRVHKICPQEFSKLYGDGPRIPAETLFYNVVRDTPEGTPTTHKQFAAPASVS